MIGVIKGDTRSLDNSSFQNLGCFHVSCEILMAFVVPSLYHGPNMCDAKETGLHSWLTQANYDTPEEPAKGAGRLLVGLLGFRVKSLFWFMLMARTILQTSACSKRWFRMPTMPAPPRRQSILELSSILFGVYYGTQYRVRLYPPFG